MKPLKETKLGKFLQSKGFDTALDVVGNMVPGVAVLNQIKDIVFSSPKKMSEEDHKMFMDLWNAEIEELQLIIDDRKNAREREIELAKLGKSDWVHKTLVMLIATLWAGWNIACFMYPDIAAQPHIKEIQIRINDFMFILVTYFFSSTAGSKLKTQLMGKQMAQ